MCYDYRVLLAEVKAEPVVGAKVNRIFPNIGSVGRHLGALCAATREERSTGRRYLIMDAFFE